MRHVAVVLIALVVLSSAGHAWAADAPGAAPTETAPPATATTPGTEDAAVTGQEAGAEAAEEPKTYTEAWIAKFDQGGRTMYVLLFLSVTAVTFIMERMFRLRRSVVVPAGLTAEADRLWREGKFTEIEALCQRRNSTLGRIIQFIVRHRGNSVSDISATAGDIAALDLRHHMRRTYPLAVVATLSPLLGLLGTVIGMIECFDIVALVGKLGDPSQLAGGISKALITTAAGLIIAIPSLGFYHYFKSKANLYGDMLEREVTGLLIEWLMPKREVA